MAGQVRRQPDAASGSIGVEEQEDGSDLSRVGSDHVMPGVDPLHTDEGVGLDGERGPAFSRTAWKARPVGPCSTREPRM